MKTLLVACTLLATLLTLGARQSAPATSSVVLDPWKTFSFEALAAEAASKHITYLPFLDRPTLSAGIYRLAAGAVDRQEPHGLDEVYYVVKGRAKLDLDGTLRGVKPGTIVYVSAGTKHRFVEIEEPLELLVLFSTAPPLADEAEPKTPATDGDER